MPWLNIACDTVWGAEVDEGLIAKTIRLWEKDIQRDVELVARTVVEQIRSHTREMG